MIKKALIILLLYCCFSKANAQVDFTYATVDSSFCVEGSFTFTATTSRTPDDLIWDFGDGQVASGNNITIIYTDPGTYTVSLIGVFPDRAVRTSKTITVNPKPDITVTANLTKICQPEPVSFTVNNSGAPAQRYIWTFPDTVITTTLPTLTENFETFGTNNVFVEAITAANCRSSSKTAVTYALIPVDLRIDTASGCIPMPNALHVSTSLNPGDALQSYEWDLGDGSPKITNTSSSIAHTYNITSPITASVKVTTQRGCVNQASLGNIGFGIPPTNLTANTIKPDTAYCGRDAVGFMAQADSVSHFRWNWGDNTIDSVRGNAAYKKYDDLGPFDAEVVAYYNGCRGESAVVPIDIIGNIVRIDFNNFCHQKNLYQFRNTSAGNVDYFRWTFNHDKANPVTTINDPLHTFPRNVTDSVNLFIIDSITGCTDELTRPIYTQEPFYEASTRVVCKDSLMIYDVRNSYPKEAGYLFNYYANDSLVSGIALDTLFFHPANYGSYPDVLIIDRNTSSLCQDTIPLPNTTLVRGPFPVIGMDTLVCQNERISFVNNSYSSVPGDSIVRYEWDFGDGTKSTDKTPPSHRFPSAGIFTVKVKITDKNNCQQTRQQNVDIMPIPKISVFPIRDTVCIGETKMIAGYSVEDLIWTPATDITCLNCDTSYVTPKDSRAYVATVKNDLGCYNSDSAVFRVYKPFQLDITPPNVAQCPPLRVDYQTNYKDLVYKWSPATFLSDTSIGNPYSIPDTSVQYTVYAEDSAGCFNDTQVLNIRVFDTAHIDPIPDRFVNYGDTFSVRPVYSNSIVKYNWSPTGNLACFDCPYPTGTATITQRYTVRGFTKDGCVDLQQFSLYLNCEGNLFVPSAFTPNGDGLNDWFYPLTRGYKYIQLFIVYDRFGNKVFERRNFLPNVASLGWDGRHHGFEKNTTRNFVYYVEAICYSNKVISQKGNVVMIK